MVLSTLKKNLAVAVVGASVLAGGSAAWASGASTQPSRAGEQASGPRASAQHEGEQHPRARAILRRAVSGDLVVRNPRTKEFENVSFDRGRLTGHDGDRLTIERPDGKTVTVQVSDQTRYRGVASASDLVVGRPVFVVHKGANATLVAQRAEGDIAPSQGGN